MPARRQPEGLTPRAKNALRLAQAEADQLNHATLDADHLLLGLIREGEGIAAQVLARRGVTLDAARAAVVDRFSAKSGGAEAEDFDASVARAERQAQNLGHTYVGTEHLLMALLENDSSILNALNVDLKALDAEVRVVATMAPGSYTIRGPKDNVVTCRVDDQSLNAIDALVEAGIRSTRSDAAAWLISSGIEANGEFFGQVFSTVTEIRRLREQAQALARRGPA